jgi:mRNA interferase MazF
VALPSGLPVSGVVLADHVKNLDCAARNAEWICCLPTNVTAEVLAKLHSPL